MQSLMRALKVKGNLQAKKEALKGLLVERFGTLNRDQFAAIKATVCRGVAVAALPAPRQVQAVPLELPPPQQEATGALPGPSGATSQPLALCRPRRSHLTAL